MAVLCVVQDSHFVIIEVNLVGKYLFELCTNAELGDKIMDDVAACAAKENPGIKSFDRRGLYRMKQFPETYKDDEFVTPLVTQIIDSLCPARFLNLCRRGSLVLPKSTFWPRLR